MLEQIDSKNTKALGAVWRRLAAFLEMHAAGEEKWFYPDLLKVGRDAGSKSTAAAEARDAIGDHNDIRDAVAKVAKHTAGTEARYASVAAVNKANSDNMGEEERESLADFRRHANLERRRDLAVQFATFEAVHFAGADAKDKNPDTYIQSNE